MSEYRKMFKNFFAFFLGDFGSKILSFVMVPFYTGILSTAQYGEIDLVTSSVNFIVPLITLNCSDAVFRFIMSKNEDKKSVFTIGIFVSLIGVIIFLLFIPFLGKYITNYSFYFYLLTMTSILYSVVSNYTKAIGKVKLVSSVGFINTFFFISFNIITLKYLSLGIEGYLLSSICSQSISILILFMGQKLWNQLQLKNIHSSLIISMLRYSLPLIPTNLCWWIIMLSDRYMITWMMGSQYTGLYAIANKVPTILQALLTIFMQAWQISATSIYEDNEKKVAVHFEKTLKYCQSLVFIFSSILIIFTQLIMMIIAKNDFYSGWICAPFLLLSISFSFVNALITTIYTIYKKNLSQFYTVFFAAIWNIGLNVLLIQVLGIVGATIASCSSYSIIMFMRLKNTQKLLNFNRHYKLIISNTIFIIIQAFLYIYIDNFILKYSIQFIFLSFILINNKFLFIDLLNRKGKLNS